MINFSKSEGTALKVHFLHHSTQTSQYTVCIDTAFEVSRLFSCSVVSDSL